MVKWMPSLEAELDQTICSIGGGDGTHSCPSPQPFNPSIRRPCSLSTSGIRTYDLSLKSLFTGLLTDLAYLAGPRKTRHLGDIGRLNRYGIMPFERRTRVAP
eukprot:5524393-Amphidinium_carterae.1